jgi:hypothetical protein
MVVEQLPADPVRTRPGSVEVTALPIRLGFKGPKIGAAKCHT